MSNPSDYLDKKYKNGDSYYAVIGYIDKPALILKDPITGDSTTVVIDCHNHQDMIELTPEQALERLEGHCLTKP